MFAKVTGDVGTIKMPAGKRIVVEVKLDKDQADVMTNIGKLIGSRVEICGPIPEADHPQQTRLDEQPPDDGGFDSENDGMDDADGEKEA